MKRASLGDYTKLLGVALILILLMGWGGCLQTAPSLIPQSAVLMQPLALDRHLLRLALCGDEQALDQLLVWLDQPSNWPKSSVSSTSARTFFKNGSTVPSSLLEDKLKIYESKHRPLLAQSFGTATIALALTSPGVGANQLAAIPSGLRSQLNWIDPQAIESVPYNSDQLSTEELFSLAPNCLVSNFSNPSTLQRYHRLGLPVEILPPPTSLGAIWQSIDQIALSAEQPLKGYRLHKACEGVTLWLSQKLQELKLPPQDLVILEFYRQFSLPSDKNLHVRWVHENLGNPCSMASTTANPWSIPVDLETLHQLKPRWILILCENPAQTAKYLFEHPRWQQLVQNNHCDYALIETSCLHSPTQLVALGLYDVVAALSSLHFKSAEN